MGVEGFLERRARVSEPWVILTVLFVAVVAAVVVTAITGRFSSPERWEYSEIAENILKGRGAYYTHLGTKYYFYGSAVYPVLLATVLRASNQSEAAMLVLQALLFALTSLVIYLIARTCFGKAEASIPAFLAASHPGGLIYVGKLHSLTLDVFLIVLSFLLLLRATSTAAPVRAIGTGLVAGLAALSRGTVVPFYSLWAAWFLWRERKRFFRAVWVVIAVAMGGALVIAPVLVSGYLMYGELIPLRTDTGENLWYGNHPGASGTPYTLSLPPVPVISQMSPELLSRIVGMTEIVQNRVFTAAVLDFAWNDPTAAFLLFLKKIYYFWWFSPHTGLLYPAAWLTAYKIYYSLVLFFAVMGLLVSLRSTRPSAWSGTSLFLLMAGSVSIVQALFHVETRHRWQVEALLLIFTAAGFLYCLRYFNKSSLTTAPAVNTPC